MKKFILLIFFVFWGWGIAWAKQVVWVYPFKVKDTPYPFISSVLTKEVLEELNSSPFIKAKVLTHKKEGALAYLVKGSCRWQSGKFFIELKFFKKNQVVNTLEKQVTGDRLFIVVSNFCDGIKSYFSKGCKKRGFLFFLKTYDPLALVKRSINSLLFPKREFKIKIPVPLPIPPNKVSNLGEGLK